MKRRVPILVAFILVLLSCCYAEEFDLPNMNSSELYELRDRIDTLLKTQHRPTSDQESAVEDAIKKFVEEYYGEENVSWAWFDYTYGREWDFFTMKTHGDVKKKDGGKAEYDIFGAVVANGKEYEVVYVQIGTEVILDQRSSRITDERVLKMIGIDENTEQMKPEGEERNDGPQEPEQEEEKQTETVVAKRGDKNETVVHIQEMLIQLGYLNGGADGDFGKKTESAVCSFQSANGLEESGEVTQTVYEAIEKAVAEMPEPANYPSYTAKELYAMYEKNEVSADVAVKGEVIKVEGAIEAITKGPLGGLYISLRADSYGFETIECSFSKKDADKLAALNKDDKVTVLGKCTGMHLLYVGLDDCELIG